MTISPKPASYTVHLFLFIALLSCLFFIGGPGAHSCRSYKAAWNLGHIIYFALLPLLLFSLPWKRTFTKTTKALIIILLALVVGVLIELIQNGLNRTPDVGDVYRDLLGAAVAIIFFLPNKDTTSKVPLMISKIVVVLLLVLQLLPIGRALIDEYQARADFPILSDFQSPFQISRWAGGARAEVVSTDKAGNKAMKVTLTTAQYSGVQLKYFPRNFAGYSRLTFEVFNPSTEPLLLTCRIHDRYHNNEYSDRFNKSYRIREGWNSIRINLEEVKEAPESRQMQLQEIQSIGIFAIHLPASRNILIDDMRLL